MTITHGRRSLGDTIANELHAMGVVPVDTSKHYREECARLRALAADVTPVEIDGETAYLKNWSAAQMLSDQWVFHVEYVVPEHNGKIHLRGVCTSDALVYDPPVFAVPTFCPRSGSPLPIKYKCLS